MVEPDGPVEVWLSQTNLQVTCTVVHEDEHTEFLNVDALSMRGAQREVTGWMINRGYTPVGRWETEADDKMTGPLETSRKFTPAKS